MLNAAVGRRHHFPVVEKPDSGEFCRPGSQVFETASVAATLTKEEPESGTWINWWPAGQMQPTEPSTPTGVDGEDMWGRVSGP